MTWRAAVCAPETPSGKGAGDENFPVGSFLLPRRLRPHVATFYAFARAIDDIADNPDLMAEEKVVRLHAFDETPIELQSLREVPAPGETPRPVLFLVHGSSFSCRTSYDLDVPAPPQDQDVADYFLFDLKKGYCDYYASAMVVLARLSGLPARFVSGYSENSLTAYWR